MVDSLPKTWKEFADQILSTDQKIISNEVLP